MWLSRVQQTPRKDRLRGTFAVVSFEEGLRVRAQQATDVGPLRGCWGGRQSLARGL